MTIHVPITAVHAQSCHLYTPRIILKQTQSFYLNILQGVFLKGKDNPSVF